MRWYRFLFFSIIFFSINVQAALYKWVDTNGKVQYSDKLPIEKQSKGVSKMSSQGTITKKAESDEERQVRLSQEELRKKELEDKNTQARYDRLLLENNVSVKDIEMKRDKILGMYFSAIDAMEKNHKSLEADLARLQKEESALGTSVEKKSRIAQTLALLKDSNMHLKLKYAEVRTIKIRYAQDIERFKFLKGL